jgi:hypothetical protein
MEGEMIDYVTQKDQPWAMKVVNDLVDPYDA